MFCCIWNLAVGCKFFKYHQELLHKNDHYEWTDVQQELHSFFQELVLVILLWELVSLFVFLEVLYQIEVVS